MLSRRFKILNNAMLAVLGSTLLAPAAFAKSDAEMEAEAAREFAKIKASAPLTTNRETIAYVACVANAVVQVLEPPHSDYNWEMAIVETSQINAFVMPGGKIVVYGSGTGLKALEGVSAYSAARAAQVGYVRTAGAEAARHNVQMNLIAQNWVENPAYFPPAFTSTPEFEKMLEANVPLGRLATAREDALFALFLASDESDFFVGQAIPFTGGWAQ